MPDGAFARFRFVEAAILTGMARDIYRLVEAGLIHYAKVSGGFRLVCSNSIMKLSTDASR